VFKDLKIFKVITFNKRKIMKNKLLLTSALAGSLLVSASAFAETKITGSIEASWSGDSASVAGTASGDGIGMETQINISNSGDLNIGGMKYQAGFSIEADGAMDAYEGAYIRVISGGTSLEVGADAFQPLDGTVTPKVSIDAASMDPNATNVITYTGQAGDDLSENMGIGLAQVIDGIGKVGIWYARSDLAGSAGGGNDGFVATDTPSGYEYNFKGNLGVEGLTVLLGKSVEEKGQTDGQKQEGEMYSAAYNFGQFAVGIARVENQSHTVGTENDTDEIGVTYSVNDNMSVGLQYIKTDIKTAGTAAADDEKIVMGSIGYNLGGIGLSLNYADVNSAGGAANADHEFFNIRLKSSF
jgi:hypothetical protein